MSDYSGLLQAIKKRVCENNGVDIFLLSVPRGDNPRVNQIWQRVAQIFILECVLDKYRMEYGSLYSPLENEKALHHMILGITKWSLPEIRALSFNDCMFIISEHLQGMGLPLHILEYLESLNLPTTSYRLDELSEEDWDPKENSFYL
ncbi:ECs1072 family phage-associated protein [Xenorhabdus bovienii]|uniref:ECs1072 family phage-associated protein n=1 Tax=Xenorhabdus bovienii TaxID=40576 RepID=UPI0008FFB625|nr:hypothetical protein [Xenorhabdus bovienii]MCG3471448.1 hypothetical protein [Xenorhabdus bovienii]